MADETKFQLGIAEQTFVQDYNFRDDWTKSPQLLAERILSRPAITCSVTMPVQKENGDQVDSITSTLPFYMTDDFGFSLSNEWASMLSDNGINTFSKLLNAVNLFNQDKQTQVTTQSKAMTAKVWQGSKFDGFNINCLFLATNRSVNPLLIVKILAAACLPSVAKTNTALNSVREMAHGATGVTKGVVGAVVDGAKSFMSDANNKKKADTMKGKVDDTIDKMDSLIDSMGMSAPLHYGLELVTKDGGGYTGDVKPIDKTTLTLQIGDYFRADNLVVQSLSNVKFSKELIAPPANNKSESFVRKYHNKDIYKPEVAVPDWGFPLYCTCTLNLQPCTMVTQDDFEKYFIGKPGSPYENLTTGNANWQTLKQGQIIAPNIIGMEEGVEY